MKIIFALILSLLSLKSYSSVFLEPQLGWSTASFNLETTPSAGVPLNGSSTGFGYGGKVGMELPYLQLGLDYMNTSFAARGILGKNTEKTLGALVGLRLDWFRILG